MITNLQYVKVQSAAKRESCLKLFIQVVFVTKQELKRNPQQKLFKSDVKINPHVPKQ